MSTLLTFIQYTVDQQARKCPWKMLFSADWLWLAIYDQLQTFDSKHCCKLLFKGWFRVIGVPSFQFGVQNPSLKGYVLDEIVHQEWKHISTLLRIVLLSNSLWVQFPEWCMCTVHISAHLNSDMLVSLGQANGTWVRFGYSWMSEFSMHFAQKVWSLVYAM